MTTTAITAKDTFGVEILPTDTLRITAWGGIVRLSDVGTVGSFVRIKRSGNVVIKADGREITVEPGMLSVARRDGKSGHQGNVGTRYDKHA